MQARLARAEEKRLAKEAAKEAAKHAAKQRKDEHQA